MERKSRVELHLQALSAVFGGGFQQRTNAMAGAGSSISAASRALWDADNTQKTTLAVPLPSSMQFPCS